MTYLKVLRRVIICDFENLHSRLYAVKHKESLFKSRICLEMKIGFVPF